MQNHIIAKILSNCFSSVTSTKYLIFYLSGKKRANSIIQKLQEQVLVQHYLIISEAYLPRISKVNAMTSEIQQQ